MKELFILSSTEQEIHATIKVRCSNLSQIISPTYSSPRLNERRILWSNLTKVAQLHQMPWLLLGDFNEVLSGEDKYGSRSININRALEFKDCLDCCNFLDLGFFGPKSTWSNCRQISDLILERIDRCFANPSWRLLYLKASVTHLTRVYSNHCSVLIELNKPSLVTRNKPFRFQSMWLLHLGFPRFVKDYQDHVQPLYPAITNFTRKVKQWNVEVFGNLFTRKKKVLARLNPNDFLIHLEKQFTEENNLIMLQEEEFQALKSRLNWMTFGHRNTSFFHTSTVVRRHRN